MKKKWLTTVCPRIEVPATRAREGAAFVEFSRRPADFAIVSIAARLALDAAGRVDFARLAAGGVAATPLRLTAAEQALLGERPDAAAIARAVATTAAIPCDGDDLNPSEYRRDLLGGLLGRALRQASARAEGRDHG